MHHRYPLGRTLPDDVDLWYLFSPCELQIAGARVGEIQNFGAPQISGTDGKPVRPHLKTLNVNLVGAIYSMSSSRLRYLPSLESLTFMSSIATQLALHYLPKTRNQTEPLKYVVFLGFLRMFGYASWCRSTDDEDVA